MCFDNKLNDILKFKDNPKKLWTGLDPYHLRVSYIPIYVYVWIRRPCFTFCVLHFFFLPTPFTLFIEYEQCIKVNEQYFMSVNSNQKLFFYCFQFLVNF